MKRSSWDRWRLERRWRDGGICIDLRMINRPSIAWYWHGNGRGSFCFSHGNGNSDPLFSLWTPEFRPPRWLTRLVLDRYGIG